MVLNSEPMESTFLTGLDADDRIRIIASLLRERGGKSLFNICFFCKLSFYVRKKDGKKVCEICLIFSFEYKSITFTITEDNMNEMLTMKDSREVKISPKNQMNNK